MKSIGYPSTSFTAECASAIAGQSALTIRVSPRKAEPIRRYLARITRAPVQPSLVLSVIDNIRVYDFVAGIAEAVIAGWRFSCSTIEEEIIVEIEPPEKN